MNSLDDVIGLGCWGLLDNFYEFMTQYGNGLVRVWFGCKYNNIDYDIGLIKSYYLPIKEKEQFLS
jgi:hypothetical protein